MPPPQQREKKQAKKSLENLKKIEKRTLDINPDNSISMGQHLRKKTENPPSYSTKTTQTPPVEKEKASESATPDKQNAPQDAEMEQTPLPENPPLLDKLSPIEGFNPQEMMESSMMEIDRLVLAPETQTPAEDSSSDEDSDVEEGEIPATPRPPQQVIPLRMKVKPTPLDELRDMNDEQLIGHVCQLRIGVSNREAIQYAFERLVPALQCPKCNTVGKFKRQVLANETIFRCKHKWKDPETFARRNCALTVDIECIWKSIMKIDTFDPNSAEAKFLSTGLWQDKKPQPKPSNQPPPKPKKTKEQELVDIMQEELNSEHLNARAKWVIRELYTKLQVYEKGMPNTMPKASYAAVTKGSTPAMPKKSQPPAKPTNPTAAILTKGIQYMEQRETQEDKRKAVGDILSGINPATGRPTGKRKPVHERMVPNIDKIEKFEFKEAIQNHSIIHIKGIQKKPLKEIRKLFSGSGLDMTKVINTAFFDHKTFQVIMENKWKEDVIAYFRSIQTKEPLEIEEPCFPTNDEDPTNRATIEAQDHYIRNMAYCCLTNRTLLGATVLQCTVPKKYQGSLLNKIDDLAAGRRAGRRNE